MVPTSPALLLSAGKIAAALPVVLVACWLPPRREDRRGLICCRPCCWMPAASTSRLAGVATIVSCQELPN